MELFTLFALNDSSLESTVTTSVTIFDQRIVMDSGAQTGALDNALYFLMKRIVSQNSLKFNINQLMCLEGFLKKNQI